MGKKQYAMVIDLHRCVGCGGCDIACKSENNVPDEFHWSNHLIETVGRFPNVRYRHIPTLCNHCGSAPCVHNCPTTAMHKTADGLTLHDPDKCIGCAACKIACPYDVIYRNNTAPHRRFREDAEPAIPDCTSTGKEVAEKAGTPIPYYNPDREKTYEGVRYKGIVEKCTFCDHRITEGEEPWCVVACPARARIFGDMNDPDSPPRKALAKHTRRVLQPEKGTQCNVYYIREY